MKASPLRGIYLLQNRWAFWGMRIIDFFLSIWSWGRKRNFPIPHPKRILLSQISHLGDVILMSSLLPLIKNKDPHIQIGVVVGSWASEIVKDHPLIDFVHFFDHWKVNRSDLSKFQKIKKTRKMSQTLISELKEIQYDVSLECSFHFPHTIFATYRAQIPVRLGYISGGFGPLLTHPFYWEEKNQSAIFYSLALLEKVFFLEEKKLKPFLKEGKTDRDLPKDYIVIHMGSGNPIKQWPIEKWKELCRRWSRQGHFLVFTGKGKREKQAIEEVTQGLENCLDLSEKLSWEESVAVVKRARLLVSVDTGLGHAASASETPAIHLYTGIHPLRLWAPLGSKKTVLTHFVPCHPCHRGKGCESMSCIREISVDEVDAALNKKIVEILENKSVNSLLGIAFDNILLDSS